jgi:hypothetical protein
VSARVRAINYFGIGEWSEFNNEGAHIRQTPSKMGPLSVVSKRETEITLSWSSLIGIATGNSDILSYNLYWDDNTGIPSILLASDLITNFTVKGTSGGKTYKF